MKKIFLKAGTLLSPVPPVMVTCGTAESPNIITVAWTGIIDTIPPMTYISLRPERYSYNIIKNSGEFVINLTTSELVKSADFCGVKSGEKINKLKETGLNLEEASTVKAPILSESPLSLECKVKEIKHFGSHDMFIAEITAIAVNENIMDRNGKIDLKKANLAAYMHGEYFELGKSLGTFGFSVRKKSVNKKRNKNKTTKKGR